MCTYIHLRIPHKATLCPIQLVYLDTTFVRTSLHVNKRKFIPVMHKWLITCKILLWSVKSCGQGIQNMFHFVWPLGIRASLLLRCNTVINAWQESTQISQLLLHSLCIELVPRSSSHIAMVSSQNTCE
jgi:hypothetical protein